MTTSSRTQPSETRLILVRHGQSESNLLGRFAGQHETPLTDLGRQQARDAAQRLLGAGIEVAYTSTLGRARETAEIICGALELQLHPSDALREMCFGPWQGEEIAEAQRRWPVDFGHYRHEPHAFALEGAETFRQVQTRMVDGIHRIAEAHPGRTVLVVSHGMAIKMLMLHRGGRGLEDLPNVETLPNGHHIEIVVPTSPA
ncbi:MAG: histidine phosphatase family protein [Myxococcota bacterium]